MDSPNPKTAGTTLSYLPAARLTRSRNMPLIYISSATGDVFRIRPLRTESSKTKLLNSNFLNTKFLRRLRALFTTRALPASETSETSETMETIEALIKCQDQDGNTPSEEPTHANPGHEKVTARPEDGVQPTDRQRGMWTKEEKDMEERMERMRTDTRSHGCVIM